MTISSELYDKVVRTMECVHSLDGNLDETEVIQVVDTLKFLTEDDLREIHSLVIYDDYEMTEEEGNPELEYDEGGLHTIAGVCESVLIASSRYMIRADNGVYYRIQINLPKGLDMHPKNQYPRVNQRCVVKAEQIHSVVDAKGMDFYVGYSEISYVPHSDEYEAWLVGSVSQAVVSQ